MAVLNGGAVSLLDVAKSWGPDGLRETRIAELLSQSNPVVEDMLWVEGNLPTGTRTTVRTGLAGATWRLFNQGVPVSKGTRAQIDETAGMLESWGEVDVDLAKLGGDPDGFRASEAPAHTEAMTQEFVGTLFYGNAGTAPEEFNGLATRYSALSQNVLSAGGTGSDNASIWVVAWGQQTVHGIYPRGYRAGLQHEDLGEQTLETVAGVGGSRMRVYQDRWTWKCGVAVRDYRYIVRIANIDISNLTSESSAANLYKLLIKAYHRIPGLNGGANPEGYVGVKPVIYMPRTVAQMFDIQTFNIATGSNGSTVYGGVSQTTIGGRYVPVFRGIPIRTVDQLLETEAQVT